MGTVEAIHALIIDVLIVCVQQEQSLEVQKAVQSKQEAHSLIEDLRKQKMVTFLPCPFFCAVFLCSR